MEIVSGSCLCGEVTYQCENTFEQFHLCHCTQCQKVTGSAHASNLFTRPDNIIWISGIELIKGYDVPGRTITSAFCNICGSPIPYLSKSGKAFVVPAGSLDAEPVISPQANIFWAERASWFEGGINCMKYDNFPKVDKG